MPKVHIRAPQVPPQDRLRSEDETRRANARSSARPKAPAASDPLGRVRLREADPVEKRHAAAFSKGRVAGPTEFTTYVVGGCTAPIWRVIHHRASPANGGRSRLEHMAVRCRQCDACKAEKQLEWRDKCEAEVSAALRTWFLTLTFAPLQYADVLMAAKAADPKRERSEDQRMASAGHRRFVRKFLRTLRKRPGVHLRYFVVAEFGAETGRLHFHMLLHEFSTYQVPRRAIEAAWKGGEVRRPRLVEVTDAQRAGGLLSYVTKYVTKTDARPRATSAVKGRFGYGEPPPVDLSRERIDFHPAPSLSPIGQAPPEDRGDGRGAENSEPGRVAEGPAPATGPGGEANGPPLEGSGPQGLRDTSSEGRDTGDGDMPGGDGAA